MYMLYPGIFYGTKVRILAYITLLFYSSMTLLLLLIIVKRFTIIQFLLADDHAKLLRKIVSSPRICFNLIQRWDFKMHFNM